MCTGTSVGESGTFTIRRRGRESRPAGQLCARGARPESTRRGFHRGGHGSGCSKSHLQLTCPHTRGIIVSRSVHANSTLRVSAGIEFRQARRIQPSVSGSTFLMSKSRKRPSGQRPGREGRAEAGARPGLPLSRRACACSRRRGPGRGPAARRPPTCRATS